MLLDAGGMLSACESESDVFVWGLIVVKVCNGNVYSRRYQTYRWGNVDVKVGK